MRNSFVNRTSQPSRRMTRLDGPIGAQGIRIGSHAEYDRILGRVQALDVIDHTGRDGTRVQAFLSTRNRRS